mgnify:CR=1 FL=1
MNYEVVVFLSNLLVERILMWYDEDKERETVDNFSEIYLLIRFNKSSQRISFLSLVKNCNHKGLGIYYLLSGFIFGISGTLISVLIRIELYSSGNRIISPENQNFYNISITLHGFLMIFFLGVLWAVLCLIILKLSRVSFKVLRQAPKKRSAAVNLSFSFRTPSISWLESGTTINRGNENSLNFILFSLALNLSLVYRLIKTKQELTFIFPFPFLPF